MKRLVRALDEAAKEVVGALAPSLLGPGMSTDDIGHCCRLPLLDPKPRNDQAYGLVDLVCYHNDSVAPKVVVSAHQDPGLLILALPEMAPGLELWCYTTKQWVSPPRGKGVLWAGQVASTLSLRPCQHRVISLHGTPRVACWHEICTQGQLSQPLLDHLERTEQELSLGDKVKGTNKVLKVLRANEDHFDAKVPRRDYSQSRAPTWLSFLSPPRSPKQPNSGIDKPASDTGISLPDTVALWDSDTFPDGIPLSKTKGVLLVPSRPPLMTAAKGSFLAGDDEPEAYNNGGLGYTVTIEHGE